MKKPAIRDDGIYGSDKTGLVWAFVFESGQAGRSIESAAVEAWLLQRGPKEFVWLHFNVANAATAPWLRTRLALPDAFEESFQPGALSRVELADDWMLAVLNDIVFFTRDTSDAATVSLCAHQHMLVSARSMPLRSVDRLREAVKRGEAARSPAELVAHLLRDQAGILVETVRESTARVDVTEDKVVSGQTAGCRVTLGNLRRVMVRLQRFLAPEPAALFRLLENPPAWLDEVDVQDLRQSAEELAAAVRESSALSERIRLLQDELFALLNEQTNRTLFVLTVVTVLALPLTIVPGLFGMNVGGVPLAQHPGGFWIAMLCALAISTIGGWFFFRRRDL